MKVNIDHKSVSLSALLELTTEVKGRIRLVRELGRHWSIITGEECFQIFDDNLSVLSRSVDEVELTEKNSTNSNTI